jgi:beta-galactosidase
MNWTDYKPGEDVTVEVYSNQPTVELYLNGKSLGAKTFDAKTSTDGVHYRETTECTNDDKNYTSGACPGSYQSPNGSSGHIHLTWHVPFQPGRLVAVARNASGRSVAQDQQQTAGTPATVTLTPDHSAIAADGKSLSYVTVDVVDNHGVTVPDAANAITFSVTGAGTFAGADNGKQDDAEGYIATTHTAFNGKVLAIVQSRDGTPGPITIHATSPGLAPATTTVLAGRSGRPTYAPRRAPARNCRPRSAWSAPTDPWWHNACTGTRPARPASAPPRSPATSPAARRSSPATALLGSSPTPPSSRSAPHPACRRR